MKRKGAYKGWKIQVMCRPRFQISCLQLSHFVRHVHLVNDWSRFEIGNLRLPVFARNSIIDSVEEESFDMHSRMISKRG